MYQFTLFPDGVAVCLHNTNHTITNNINITTSNDNTTNHHYSTNTSTYHSTYYSAYYTTNTYNIYNNCLEGWPTLRSCAPHTPGSITASKANSLINLHAVQTNGLEACCLEGWPTLRFCVYALACVCLYSLSLFTLHSLVAAVSGVILDDGATITQCYPAVLCIFFYLHMILPACLRLVFRHALLLLFITNILDYDKRIVDS